MPQIKGTNWARILEPVLNTYYTPIVREQPDIISALFDVQSSDKHDEDVFNSGGISMDSWEQFQKTNQVPEVNIDAGYETTFTHSAYPLDLRIDYTLIQDDKHGAVRKMVEDLAMSAQRKKLYDAWSIFINAFSSSHLGADAVALCSDSHPNGPDHTGTTQDNNNTLSLTKANVSTVRLAMMDFKDDKGNPVGIVPDLIVVPPELEESVFEITRSQFDPTSGNNTANFHYGQFQYLTSQYLTDSNAWFMVDTVAMRQRLHWFNREMPSLTLAEENPKVWAKYRAYMRYSFGWSDWKWIYGNNPS